MVIETNPGTLEELAFAGLDSGAAERAGTLTVTGDRSQLDRLFGLFPV